MKPAPPVMTSTRLSYSLVLVDKVSEEIGEGGDESIMTE